MVAGWSDVHVDHVETEGLSDSPEIGGALDLRVFVSLGSLAPADVARRGRPRPGRAARTSSSTPRRRRCALAETYEGGRHRFDGHVTLDRAGSFGYTVRVLPRNPTSPRPPSWGWSRSRRRPRRTAGTASVGSWP